MNKQRRKQIADAAGMIDMLIENASHGQNPSDGINEEFYNEKTDILNDVQSILDEEQAYLDNIPENMQGGQRYSDSEEVISNLELALDNLEAAESDLNVEDFCDYLQQAADALGDAV